MLRQCSMREFCPSPYNIALGLWTRLMFVYIPTTSESSLHQSLGSGRGVEIRKPGVMCCNPRVRPDPGLPILSCLRLGGCTANEMLLMSIPSLNRHRYSKPDPTRTILPLGNKANVTPP